MLRSIQEGRRLYPV